MIVKDLDGYWMARASIGEAKGEDGDLPVEIFIAGPPTADDEISGLVLMGFSAFMNLRALLNDEYDRYQESIALAVEDI